MNTTGTWYDNSPSWRSKSSPPRAQIDLTRPPAVLFERSPIYIYKGGHISQPIRFGGYFSTGYRSQRRRNLREPAGVVVHPLIVAGRIGGKKKKEGPSRVFSSRRGNTPSRQNKRTGWRRKFKRNKKKRNSTAQQQNVESATLFFCFRVSARPKEADTPKNWMPWRTHVPEKGKGGGWAEKPRHQQIFLARIQRQSRQREREMGR